METAIINSEALSDGSKAFFVTIRIDGKHFKFDCMDENHARSLKENLDNVSGFESDI